MERSRELIHDNEIVSEQVRVKVERRRGEGVGVIEAGVRDVFDPRAEDATGVRTDRRAVGGELVFGFAIAAVASSVPPASPNAPLPTPAEAHKVPITSA